MNRGMVKLCEIIPGVGFPPEPEKKEIRAPRPTPPKVVGDPTRTPVNLQAALIVQKASWIHKPLPPELAPVGELEQLREENAKLKATNANIVAENSALRKRVTLLQKLVEAKKPKQQVRLPEPPQKMAQSKKQQLLERLTR
tara:strand:+ start:1416 stop:1838 length:423 start_codon:yes stop_codon:yes gene_type:complete